MAFANSSNIQVKNSTFNDVKGDQINYIVNSGAAPSNRFQSLDRLQYAGGASFDRNKICLPNTRTALINNIWSRVMSTDEKNMAEIVWLTSVAGAGKTTVAHTIARRCADEGILSSSFFFDRNVAGRNVPTKLFSTIARDFADQNVSFGEGVAEALDKKRSLTEASPSLHFTELILGPSRCLPLDKPAVIIIDALDEGCDLEALTILRDEVPKLPGNFRILVTSRITRELKMFLSKNPNVFPMSINVDDPPNMTDIAIYARHMLRAVAAWGDLNEDWPDSLLLDEFIMRAGGLFVWVFIVSEYLRMSVNPDAKLKALLSKQSSSNLSAEVKMDSMYSTILEGCKWDDEDFVQGYNLLMGAIIAAKTPLSMSALGSLHRHDLPLPARNYLRPLAPLLTNFEDDSATVKVLHLSLKEFLTIRARSSPDSLKLFLDEDEHSRRLGFLCLMVMNEDLKKCGSALGYLRESSELTEVPEIGENVISEELLYACNFWMDHVVETENIGPELTVALHIFLENYIVRWVEVVMSRGRFQNLARARRWLKRTYPEDIVFKKYIFNRDVIAAFYDASRLLSSMDRREESYEAILEALELHRQLSIDCSTVYDANLPRYLHRLSYCLSRLGHREEALDAIREAVDLCRPLAKDRPAVFNDDLAGSLNNLSRYLSDVGHREEALDAIQEAVELYRQLAKDQPAVFNAKLANSLNNLSNELSYVGHREESLDAIREAVDLRRQLAKDRPTVFNADLALSLNNLSSELSDAGHREESLDAIREAVELYRQLAKNRPALFNADLADSLNNLSYQLSNVGPREESLDAIQEAVALHRQLAKNRPAVFNANLANSLHNLFLRLSNVGQREEALGVIREAVDLRRHLAKDLPAVFNADLALSLHKLSNELLNVGHREEALDAIQEAVELYRQLAKDQPAVFNAYFAGLSYQVLSVEHGEEALDTIQEAVELYRRLAKDRPAVFTADLCGSLNNFFNRLSDVGHRDAVNITLEVDALRCQLQAKE